MRARQHRFFPGDLPSSSATCSAAFDRAIRNDHMRSALRRNSRHFPADSAAPAHHQCNLPAQFLLRRLAANLRLLQRPVLNPERLARRQRHIIVVNLKLLRRCRCACLRKNVGHLTQSAQPCRALHHVNRIHIKLARNARLGLVLAEAELPTPGISTTVGFASRSAGEFGTACFV